MERPRLVVLGENPVQVVVEAAAAGDAVEVLRHPGELCRLVRREAAPAVKVLRQLATERQEVVVGRQPGRRPAPDERRPGAEEGDDLAVGEAIADQRVGRLGLDLAGRGGGFLDPRHGPR